MRGSFVTSRAFLLVLGVLVWLTVSVVIAAAPLLTKSSEQPARARPRAPTTVPAPAQDPIPRFPPQLALHARAAANAPGELRLRISTSGTFRPTTETPARLRVVLTATEASGTAPFDRIIRRVSVTDAVLSAVFRHLQPGTWRWEVDAPSSWTLAFVNRDSGRVAVRAPAPPPEPPPAPEPVDNATEGAAAQAQAPEPAHESGSATTSTQSGVPAAQSPNPAPTQGGSGGQSNQPAPPFGGGGAPSPEGPHAP